MVQCMGRWKCGWPPRRVMIAILRCHHRHNNFFVIVFRANDAPRYIKAFIAHMVVYGVQLVVIVTLRLRLMRLNALKRRAQKDFDDAANRVRYYMTSSSCCSTSDQRSRNELSTNTHLTILRTRKIRIVRIRRTLRDGF